MTVNIISDRPAIAGYALDDLAPKPALAAFYSDFARRVHVGRATYLSAAADLWSWTAGGFAQVAYRAAGPATGEDSPDALVDDFTGPFPTPRGASLCIEATPRIAAGSRFNLTGAAKSGVTVQAVGAGPGATYAVLGEGAGDLPRYISIPAVAVTASTVWVSASIDALWHGEDARYLQLSVADNIAAYANFDLKTGAVAFAAPGVTADILRRPDGSVTCAIRYYRAAAYTPAPAVQVARVPAAGSGYLAPAPLAGRMLLRLPTMSVDTSLSGVALRNPVQSDSTTASVSGAALTVLPAALDRANPYTLLVTGDVPQSTIKTASSVLLTIAAATQIKVQVTGWAPELVVGAAVTSLGPALTPGQRICMAVSVEATQLVICLNGQLTVVPLTANPLGSTIILGSSTTPKSSAWSGHIERVIGWEVVKAAHELIRIEARYR